VEKNTRRTGVSPGGGATAHGFYSWGGRLAERRGTLGSDAWKKVRGNKGRERRGRASRVRLGNAAQGASVASKTAGVTKKGEHPEERGVGTGPSKF